MIYVLNDHSYTMAKASSDLLNPIQMKTTSSTERELEGKGCGERKDDCEPRLELIWFAAARVIRPTRSPQAT